MAQIQPFSFMLLLQKPLLPNASGLIGPLQLIPTAVAKVK
jgi:hypothetical protein